MAISELSPSGAEQYRYNFTLRVAQYCQLPTKKKGRLAAARVGWRNWWLRNRCER